MRDELQHSCPVDDIAAYIDGELETAKERELETHLENCSICSIEMNEQKHFLRSLEASLQHEQEVDLPPDFAKHVVARAESSVSGLRKPAERFHAVFIIAAIGLFVLFATGADAGRMLSILDQIAAVGTFFGHMVYSFFVGLAIIVRATALQVDGGISMVILLSLAAAGCSLFISRKVLTTRGI